MLLSVYLMLKSKLRFFLFQTEVFNILLNMKLISNLSKMKCLLNKICIFERKLRNSFLIKFLF